MIADSLIFIRSAHFAATLLASGTVCFMALVAAPSTRPPRDIAALRWRLNVMTWVGLALAVLTGAMWLVWLAADILGEPLIDVCLHGGVLSVLTDTRFGWVWCMRAALAILLAFLILDPGWRVFQVVAASALLVLPAFVGHAGATPGLKGVVPLASDAAHLLAAGVWLGALPAFAMLLWTAGQKKTQSWPDFVVAATRRFSMLAAAAVGVLLTSGIVNGLSLLGSLRGLWTTDYGRVVVLKGILLGAMIAVASVNKFHLTPQLPAAMALRRLRRNSLAEIAIGLCVLLLVGFLGRLQPAAHVHPVSTPVPADAAFTHIHTPEAMAEVTINPGRAGHAKVTIRVMREDFSDFAAKDVRVILEPPPGSGTPNEYATARQSDGSWTIADVVLPQPGTWTVQVIVIGRSGEAIVLDAPVAIAR